MADTIRRELYLDAIINGTGTIPDPVSREDYFLAKIAGADVQLPPPPYSAYETYLARIAGEAVTVPAPVSRLDMFLYAACGEDIELPSPISREEMFWAEYIENTGAKSILVTILPVQAGSGDPSSENVRAISGWTVVDLRNTGDNLWGGDDMMADLKRYFPSATVDDTNRTIAFGSGTNPVSGTVLLGETGNRIYGLKFKEDTRYTVVMTAQKTSSKYLNLKFTYTSGSDKQLLLSQYGEKETNAIASDANSTIRYLNKSSKSGTGTFYVDECGLFEGVLDEEDFVAYDGKSYKASLGETVYGGTLDFVTGTLTITHGYIASYDGETLPGKWISSKDVYSAGTTPSTGAQVVYELATPVVKTITGSNLPDVSGFDATKNYWADAGSVTVA